MTTPRKVPLPSSPPKPGPPSGPRSSSRIRPPQPAPQYRRLADRDEVDAVLASFTLPRTLRRALKEAALALNWSMSELLRTAAQEWLDRHRPTNRGRATR